MKPTWAEFLPLYALLILAPALGCGRSEFYRYEFLTDDAGGSSDAGTRVDAGDAGDGGHDAGQLPDAGPPDLDGGCRLTVLPPSIDFGTVALGSSVTQQVTVSNQGEGTCQVSQVALGVGTDPLFALSSTQAGSFDLAAGQDATIAVTFTANNAMPPSHRQGTLTLATSDPKHPTFSVPLSATVQVGCAISVQPASLDLGTVTLNLKASGQVTLANIGNEPCAVSGVALAAGSDPLFSLAASQVASFSIAPGSSASIAVAFNGTVADPPHARAATLGFTTTDVAHPQLTTVPISATINAACAEDSNWIFTVDSDTTLSRFDPVKLTFDDIKKVDCRDSTGAQDFSGPNSMAVDMNGVAWAGYRSGALYRIDTTDGSCQATSFVVDQHGLFVFGMEFLFDPPTSTETLYVAGGAGVSPAASTLATIDMSSLVLSVVGTVSIGFIEPGATPGGQLWGFAPGTTSVNGVPTLARIDPTNATLLTSTGYPAITENGDFAMKFFQGGFFIFDSPAVYRVDLATGALTTEIGPLNHPEKMLRPDGTGSFREVIGAGFAMCPPPS